MSQRQTNVVVTLIMLLVISAGILIGWKAYELIKTL